MLEAWNVNMTEQFTPSWVSCLDESMSTWMNKYSCPGWMFVPRKPWPFGNEYYTVCCSLSGILWQMELVGGKDSPSEIIPKYNNQGENVGLLLRVLEPIITPGFCVLKGIVELKKCGVYAMKEPDYVMSLMSMYGTNQRSGKETTREWVDGSGNGQKNKFNYPEVVGNHFLYRHSVDDHNNKHHSPFSLEVV